MAAPETRLPSRIGSGAAAAPTRLLAAQIAVADEVVWSETVVVAGVASKPESTATLRTTATYLTEKPDTSTQNCQTLWLQQGPDGGNLCESPVQESFGLHVEDLGSPEPRVVQVKS
jgi:hypothetical protein